MKLEPTFFRSRSLLASSSRPDVSLVTRGEAGADAEDVSTWMADMYGGGPDVNPALSGPQKFVEFREMAATDPTIKGMLLYFALPTTSASWGLNPKDEADPQSRFYTDFVAWNLGLEEELGQLDLSWKRLNRQILETALRDGTFFGELVWDIPAGEQPLRSWRDADGDSHAVVPLVRVSPRPNLSIQKVTRNSDGSIKTLKQSLPNTKEIPGRKLFTFVPEPKPGSWEGVSMIRPAWGAWRLKKALMISAGMAWDRYGLPIPAIWHPDNNQDREIARAIGRNLRAHERGYVHFPSQGMLGAGAPDSEWWIQLLSGTSQIGDPTPLLRWLVEQQVEAALQQFSQLGNTETGARAVGEVQIDPFFLAVQALAEDLRVEWMRQIVRKVVEVNFGEQAAEEQCPVLTVSKVRARSIEVLAKALALLEPLGYRLTEPEDQNDVRELVGFAKMTDDQLAEQPADGAGAITYAQVEAALTQAGVDPAAIAQVTAALPKPSANGRKPPPREGDALQLKLPT